jgi:DNA-binding NarL/FixJ family response regulator
VPKCILIVDDHEHIRKLVRAFLESEAAFEVCGEAVDGFDAIQKAQASKPDLIILDLSMPRMGRSRSEIEKVPPVNSNRSFHLARHAIGSALLFFSRASICPA